MNRILATAILVSVMASPSLAQEVVPDEEDNNAPKKEYSPYVEDDYPNRVWFGDTHLHTSWSYDAGMFSSSLSLGPDDAYRVSRGDVVTSHQGWKVKLIKPLDFVVVSDHAENLGLIDFIQRSDPILLANETGKRWHDLVKAGNRREVSRELLGGTRKHQDLINEPRMMEAAWSNVAKNADEYYQPGVFTTFHGFEWTSHIGGNNLHRVVIFRDARDKTSQILPYSQYDSVDAEDLWAYMAAYEEKTGGRVLAAAHNGNFSNGLMFDTKTYGGDPLTTAYAQTRARFEPIYEVTQTKGDGETHPLVSPDDPFADFETMDKGNLAGTTAKTPDMLPKEYARPALMEGLRLEQQLGANPFKFGLIGSTDNHTALPTSREENHFGQSSASGAEPSEERYKVVLFPGAEPEQDLKIVDFGASGLAAVWARENTREAIWDAMVRREVYATTGNRLQVRVFGGWDFEPDEVQRSDFARQGYARGVPMGGDLTNAPAGKAPTFMIRALRDADGANLDRIQVIKGWLDNNGETNEQVYNVAVSDGRRIRRNNSVSDVGNTVDIADASYTNTIGDPVLEAHWEDPDFNPQQRAFYYVRVIEIPTPRWTAYDAKFFTIDMPDDIKMEVQDRAYTSPIWYTP